MNLSLYDSRGEIVWTSVAMVAFALVFLVIGILRIVEFDGLGLTRFKKTTLVVAHILGCLVFAGAISIMALDLHQAYVKPMRASLMFGIFLLFPVHIYAGIRRRIVLQDRNP